MNSRRWICHSYIRHYNKFSKLISLAYKTYYTSMYIGEDNNCYGGISAREYRRLIDDDQTRAKALFLQLYVVTDANS